MYSSDDTLTDKQIFWLFLSMQIVMTILLTPSAAIQEAKQDAWLSGIISIIYAWITIASSLYVCSKYPQLNFYKVSQKVLGKILGSILSFILLVSFTIVLSAILRQYASFIVGTILPQTPISVVIICMLLVAIYPTYHGIGVIGRISEIVGPLVLLGIFLPAVLGVGNLNLKWLLPIYFDSGMLPIMKGSLTPAVFLIDAVLILWLHNLVDKNQKNFQKYFYFSILCSGLITLITTLLIILTFGPEIASSYVYPFLMLERYISIIGIIENLDSIVITIWILSIFVKICLYLFVISYGFSQMFKGRSHKKTIFWVSPIVLMLSLLPQNTLQISIEFPRYIAVPFILPLWMGLPVLMAIIVKVRHS